MKTFLSSISLTASLIAFAVSSSFASDIFLKIDGPIKGESKIVKFACASGACKASLEGVKTGKYTFTLCDASGKVLMKAKEKANREPSPGATTESISINFTKITFIYDVVVTGNGSVSGAKDGVHPDGKRQHTNIIINKRLSPGEGFVTTGDVNGDGRLDLSFSWTSSNGGISALDDWEAPSVH